ncbi:uncharacterized protein LOC125324540 [Corvus hawaiiensis]|uniref:uncharacterized protein LOC125324540 n=1 Tax=Corvus hawaiiensis TaxID=134902 RepID=UPI0020192641|nr:uncharacterized protein LOC125324540 [Corvus hawaiiensis]XP_048156478.1 uncharacterized protein LOC125324540 [Corvus hawaiiensis]
MAGSGGTNRDRMGQDATGRDAAAPPGATESRCSGCSTQAPPLPTAAPRRRAPPGPPPPPPSPLRTRGAGPSPSRTALRLGQPGPQAGRGAQPSRMGSVDGTGPLGWIGMDGWMDGRTDRQWSSKAQNPAKNQGVGNCHMRCSVASLCPVLWCQHTWLRSAIPGGGGRAAIHGQVWPWHGQRGPTSPDQPLPGGVAVAGSTRRCCLPRGTGAAARNEWLCWSCVCTPAFHISSLASAGERGGFVGRWQSLLSSQGKGLLVPVSLKNTLPSLFAVPE